MGTVRSGMITVTNTVTDTAGERLRTLRTTVVGLTAEDLNPAIKTAVHKTLMHDMDIFGVGEEEYHKTERPGDRQPLDLSTSLA